MKNNIIGRKSEQDTLARIYESRQSEFVAVCGRRRVGKTFLVREYFEQEMVFQTSGLAGGNTQEQLKNFFYSLAIFVFAGNFSFYSNFFEVIFFFNS